MWTRNGSAVHDRITGRVEVAAKSFRPSAVGRKNRRFSHFFLTILSHSLLLDYDLTSSFMSASLLR
jgi:hypothetical protein